MRASLKTFFALWFISQIVLPFTAPLETCDIRDLLGSHNHSTQPANESSAIPTPDDASASAVLVWPLDGPVLCEAEPSLTPRRGAATALETIQPPSSPEVQQTVLRL